MLTELRPEFQLLLLAAAPSPCPQRRESLLTQPLDWRYLADAADRHSLLPLLFRLLKGQPQTPPALLEHLRSVTKFIATRNLDLTAGLIGMIRALAAAGITAVPFKGPALAVAAYGDLSLRGFSDLDILVRPEDLRRAAAELVKQGFQTDIDLESPAGRRYYEAENALQMRNGRDVVVELHWRFMERSYSSPIDMAGVWNRLTRTKLLATGIPAIHPVDLLLYLSVHGTKHRWARLEWIASIAHFLHRNPDIDWNLVRRRAAEWRVTRLFHLTLHLLTEFFGVNLPPDIRAAAERDRPAAELAGQVGAALATGAPLAPGIMQRASHHMFLMRSREHLSDRLRIAVRSGIRSPHPKSHELLALPRGLHFLYYVLRPIRLLGQYGRFAWRSCIKSLG